jgi:hypothetical protein
MQAQMGGILPPWLKVTGRGRYGVDVWDPRTGKSWDLTTARVREVAGHDVRYIGKAMPDGTVIIDLIVLVYTRQ